MNKPTVKVFDPKKEIVLTSDASELCQQYYHRAAIHLCTYLEN